MLVALAVAVALYAQTDVKQELCAAIAKGDEGALDHCINPPPAPAFQEWAQANLEDRDWTPFIQGANSRVYYRGAPSGTQPTLWTRWEVRPGYSFEAPSSVALIQYDCATGQSRTLQNTRYAAQNMSGAGTTLTGPDVWAYAIPGTIGEALQEFACRKR